MFLFVCNFVSFNVAVLLDIKKDLAFFLVGRGVAWRLLNKQRHSIVIFLIGGEGSKYWLILYMYFCPQAIELWLHLNLPYPSQSKPSNTLEFIVNSQGDSCKANFEMVLSTLHPIPQPCPATSRATHLVATFFPCINEIQRKKIEQICNLVAWVSGFPGGGEKGKGKPDTTAQFWAFCPLEIRYASLK